MSLPKRKYLKLKAQKQDYGGRRSDFHKPDSSREASTQNKPSAAAQQS